MRCMDGHCDVLYKLWCNPELSFYGNDPSLDVTFDYLCASEIWLQTFAVYVPTNVPSAQRFHTALAQIDLFYTHVLSDRLHVIQSRKDILNNRRGAILALEGAGALSGEISYLRHFHRLGVRQVGLTWNYANEVADGILEERGGGLTQFGRLVVDEMERLGIILDVSHLSESGFWEVIEKELPILASHSNARSICSHVRNLKDDQIKALIEKEGLIGITFVPQFVHETNPSIDTILKHIEHICMLGGENNLFFGSDFDGIEKKIPQLEHAGHLYNLKKRLIKYYDETLVSKWLWNNGYQFYRDHLE